ncbi:atos homolog protein A-like [Lineus longissimus]|uniref:atos homolog protein A-like n=1 Tax=Lineus longissimus TaxID=88925 RepID=UPI002B4D4727
MKPELGMAGSMEEEPEVDASRLFRDVGMLILEARIPDESPKGRHEGPHCPLLKQEGKHVCKEEETLCKRANGLNEEMLFLWRNEIPLCIEVVAYPDCSHGRMATERDTAPGGAEENYSLLERWMIQTIPRKPCVPHVTNWSLFQALRSYLYFSQLSSWLTASKGTKPKYWDVGIVPPGELDVNRFSQKPDCHNFPIMHISRTSSIKISVLTRPRSQELPRIPCPLSHQDELCKSDAGKSRDNEKKERDWSPCRYDDWGIASNISADRMRTKQAGNHGYHDVATATPSTSRQLSVTSSDCSQNQQYPPKNRQAMQQRQQQEYDPTSWSKKLSNHPENTIRNMPQPVRNTGAIPKQPKMTDYKQDMFLPLNSAGAAIPQQKPAYKTLKSPMVLMTEQIGMQLYFGRESYGGPALPQRNKVPYVELSPSEIERYLTSLCQHRNKSDSPDSLSPSSLESRSPLVLSPKFEKFPTASQDFNTHSLSYDAPAQPVRNDRNDVSDSQRTTMTTPSGVKMSPSYERTCLIGKMDSNRRYDLNNAKIAKVLDYDEPEVDVQNQSQSDILSCQGRLESRCLSPRITSHSSSSSAESVQTIVSATCGSVSNSPKTSGLFVELKAEELSQKLQKAKLTDSSNGNLGSQAELSDKNSCSDRAKFYIGENSDNEEDDGLVEKGDFVENGAGKELSHNGAEISQNGDIVKQCEVKTENGVFNHANVASLEKPELAENGVYKIRNRVVENRVADSMRDARNVSSADGVTKGFKKSTSLLQSLMKEKASNQENVPPTKSMPIPTEKDKTNFHRNYTASASMLFNYATGLPMQSSPAPIKKNQTHAFGFDTTLTHPRAIKNAISCYALDSNEKSNNQDDVPINNKLSRSAPASTNSLLGNFEESLLNGRIDPVGIVDGFNAEIGASGSFCPKHVHIPVTAYFFKLSDDNAPSPYLGHINLESVGKKGYHVPKKGTVQVTLFNPSKNVVKMFVVMYDLSDMPSNCQTFLRQRTLYMPVADCRQDQEMEELPAYLRYLIHLRFKSSKTGRIYLHTDIRVIFARDKFEFDPRVATYELRSFTEGPSNPKFSPIK